MPIPTATIATPIDVRAPIMSIESVSRPKWSVPSQWSEPGGWSFRAMSSSSTGNGDHTNDTQATITKKADSAVPARSDGDRIMTGS